MYRLIIGALVSPFFIFSVAANEVDQQLIEADTLRSQDVAAFRASLSTLSNKAATFSPAQLQYFNYLTAYSMSYSGKLIEAVPTYESVFQSATDKSLKLRAKNSILNNYALVRDFPKALQQIPDIVPLLSFAQGKDKHLAILTIALFYNQLEEFEQSLQYSDRVINQDLSLRNACLAHNLRSESLHNLGRLERDTLVKTIEVCEKSKEPIALNLAKLWLAQLMLQSADGVSAALDYLLAIQADVESTNYPRLTSEYYTALAESYFANNLYHNAQESALKGAELAKGMGYSKPRKTAYYILYQSAKEQGDSAKALDAYIQFAEADKAYLDEYNVKQMAIQQAKFDNLEKNIEIQLLDKENNLLKAQAALSREEKQNHRLLITLLASITILVLMWAVINRKLHAALREKAQTDSLTKVANRHYFTELASKAMKRASDNNDVLSFVIFDLDHFKKVNDSYGHPKGDWVLKAVVNAVKKHCRKEDVFGRLGGEEFGLLLPGCHEEKAKEIAENMRESISQIDTSESGHTFNITASFGISSTSSSNFQFELLYANADEALYSSKKHGRNRVSMFQVPDNDKLGNVGQTFQPA
ncbi:diguanylate cyclase [Alteromonas gracilis]|uniref:tetratricopeptide repeat-containing diguanylate cyclase n=1 Tax=Alteromonas gracilis TaxID=1479524 RepID=UPI0037359375